MPKAFTVEEVLSTDEPGLWTSTAPFSHNLPETGKTDYTLARTRNGIWSIALRGYQEGKDIRLEPRNGSDFVAVLNNRAYDTGFRMLNGFQLARVPSDQEDEFRETMREPDPRTLKTATRLFHVLEQGINGHWNIYYPAEYCDPEYAGALVYGEDAPDLVGISWSPGKTHPIKGYWYHPEVESTAARVITDGPEFLITPYSLTKSGGGLTVSSIADRVAGQHWMVSGRDISQDEAAALKSDGFVNVD